MDHCEYRMDTLVLTFGVETLFLLKTKEEIKEIISDI